MVSISYIGIIEFTKENASERMQLESGFFQEYNSFLAKIETAHKIETNTFLQFSTLLW